jgi:hypothetical protein
LAGLGIIGIKLEGGFEFGDAVIQMAGHAESGTEVVVVVGADGVELDGGLKLDDGVGVTMLAHEQGAEIAAAFGVIGLQFLRGVELINGFSEARIVSGENFGDVIVRERVGRADGGGGLERGESVVAMAGLGEGHAEADERMRFAGAAIEGGVKLGDSVVEFPLFNESEAEVVMGFEVMRGGFQRKAVEADGVVKLAAVGKGNGEADLGEGIILGGIHGAAEHGFGVAPESDLALGESGAGNGAGKAETGTSDGSAPGVLNKDAAGPYQHEHDANGGKIGVTVGDGLIADFDEADDGDEHDEIPEPADEEGRAHLPEHNEEGGYGEKKCGGCGDFEQRDRSRKRVDGRKICGPDDFAEIAAIGNDGVEETRAQADGSGHRAAVRLDGECNDAEGSGEDEKRNFFGEEPGDTAFAEATERPIIQKEQNEGSRHEHGFGHEAEGKEHEGEGVIKFGFCVGEFGGESVAGVSQQRQQEKETAEDVLALRGPGDGFDTERMQAEEQGNEKRGDLELGEAEEEKKNEGSIGGVEEDIAEVVAPRLQAEKPAIEEVREVGDGVPICAVESESPLEAIPGEAVFDVDVVGDVFGVVVIDKAVFDNGEKHEERRQEQEQSREPGIFGRGRSGRRFEAGVGHLRSRRVSGWQGGFNSWRSRLRMEKCSCWRRAFAIVVL